MTKLTKAQKDILDRMDDGWTLTSKYTLGTNRYFLRNGEAVERVSTAVVNALRSAGIVIETARHYTDATYGRN